MNEEDWKVRTDDHQHKNYLSHEKILFPHFVHYILDDLMNDSAIKATVWDNGIK